MSSPWAKISVPEPVNLQEIMSEQGARNLQDKRNQKFTDSVKQQVEAQQTNTEEDLLSHLQAGVEDRADPDSEALIGQMLQEVCDEEYKGTENRRDSNISILFNDYQRIPQNKDFESDSEDEEEINSDIPLDGYDLQCSDKVFNSLKPHSKQEQNRRHKIHNKKEEGIFEFDMDEFTKPQVHLLKRVNNVISEGKESTIWHAESNPSYPHATLPKECVVKVFKRTLAEFKRPEDHTEDDYPLNVKVGNKAKIRQTTHLWAEKEAHNLRRLANVGIACPEVVAVRKHMVVMSFIGKNHIPAPKLKDAKLTTDDLVKAYNQIMNMMVSMFWGARLVHADLSENNILWHEGQCYFMDVGQCVELYHPKLLQFLMRDCKNITRFFEQKNTPKTETAGDLFHRITPYRFRDKKHLDKLLTDFKYHEEHDDAAHADLAVNVRPGLTH